eukprot:10662492-Karenia_brevis.AAC.1
MEDVADVRRGDVVADLSADAVQLVDRAITTTAQGPMACRLIPRANVTKFITEDLRILPVKFDGSGKRR